VVVRGPAARHILDAEAQVMAPSAVGSGPVVWDRAFGTEVVDVDGKRYVDFTSGVLVTNTGHCHPRVVEAIRDQAGALLNCFAAPHPLRSRLASRLTGLLPGALSQVAFFSSGTEAVEAAIKVARNATGRHDVVSFQGAFHGRTYLSMALAGLEDDRSHYGPLPAGIVHAPFPYPYRCDRAEAHDCSNHALADLEHLLATELSGPPAAIVVEPYQGSAGSRVAPPAFVRALRELCDRHGALLVADEVQAGFGRTGTFFAFEQWGAVPDILVLGKGMASGVPISGVVASPEVFSAVPPGGLTSTFGGNPLACAAALATIDVIEDERLPERAERIGRRLLHALRACEIELVGDVRGIGLAIGIELVRDRRSKEPAAAEACAVVDRAAELGLVLIPPIGLFGNVIRIAPPLTISDELADEGVGRLIQALGEVDASQRGTRRVPATEVGR
jgi:4-aminobutyrate aminotransferase